MFTRVVFWSTWVTILLWLSCFSPGLFHVNALNLLTSGLGQHLLHHQVRMSRPSALTVPPEEAQSEKVGETKVALEATWVPDLPDAPLQLPGAEPAWSPPREFDGYHIRRSIGRGAMGEVFLAYDTLLDRLVGVKFIYALVAGSEQRERFLAEGRAIARLQHPNVLTIYRVGEVEGRPYLSSEFIEGTPLDELEIPLPWKKVLEIGIGLARGLAAAHRRGVLHRDVKAANAILSKTGEVKLLDFGLAKVVEVTDAPVVEAGTSYSRVPSGLRRPPPETNHSGLAGTPLYMAPEIWAGEGATFRSDVYSMGILLYQLLSGATLHVAATLGELRRMACSTPAPPLTEVIDADPRLASIIQRCLEISPENRFTNADELRDALEQLEATAADAAIPQGNPYRGLAAFEAEHRGLFFGRDADVRALLERLRVESFLVVMGASGVGKSSLCRAGVLPRVASGALGEGRTWSTVMLKPGQHPLAALCSVLAPFLSTDEESLAAKLRKEPSVLGRLLRRPHAGDAGLMIFVDQLEELVTIAEPAEAAIVAEALSSLYAPAPRLRLLATTRADFVTRIAGLPGLGAELARTFHLLCPLTVENVREAIVGPARVKGVRFENEEMVDNLVAAATNAEGALPLLQFALAELWEHRDKEHHRILASSLIPLGGVAGALARHGDRVVDRMLPEQRAVTPRLLVDLITKESTRARRQETELLRGDERAVKGALDALVSGRLLVAHAALGGASYEIAHEALIKGWPTLQRWTENERDGRAARERLATAVDEWERLGRTPDALWSARQLDEATRLEAGGLQRTEAEFIAASRKAYARKRWLRSALVAVLALTVIGVWGAARLSTSLALKRRVETFVADASEKLNRAREMTATSEQLKHQALEQMDLGNQDEGERVWLEALTIKKDVDRTLGRATQALDEAIVLGSSDGRVRELLADAIYARALLAEQSGATERMTELIELLPLYDASGQRMARWNAPALLTVTTEPPGAQITVEQFVKDEQAQMKGLPAKELSSGAESLPQGTYVVTVNAPGHAETRLPIFLERGERLPLSIRLLKAEFVPKGYVYVAAGRFIYGTRAEERDRRDFLHTVPAHSMHTDGFLVAQHETTWADWLEYLKALSPAEKAKRTPKMDEGGFHGALSITQETTGLWKLTLQPGTKAFVALEGEPIVYSERPSRTQQDWRRMPVSGIDFESAEAYARWLAETKRLPGARLCDEREWERAARGADDREYPHGSQLKADDANLDDTYGKSPLTLGPDEVGSHAASRSPFGIDDATGNVWEWARSVSGKKDFVVRGGSFLFGHNSGRVTNRELVEPTLRDVSLGMRVCADVPSL